MSQVRGSRQQQRPHSRNVDEIVRELDQIHHKRENRKRGVIVLGGLAALAVLIGGSTLIANSNGKEGARDVGLAQRDVGLAQQNDATDIAEASPPGAPLDVGAVSVTGSGTAVVAGFLPGGTTPAVSSPTGPSRSIGTGGFVPNPDDGVIEGVGAVLSANPVTGPVTGGNNPGDTGIDINVNTGNGGSNGGGGSGGGGSNGGGDGNNGGGNNGGGNNGGGGSGGDDDTGSGAGIDISLGSDDGGVGLSASLQGNNGAGISLNLNGSTTPDAESTLTLSGPNGNDTSVNVDLNGENGILSTDLGNGGSGLDGVVDDVTGSLGDLTGGLTDESLLGGLGGATDGLLGGGNGGSGGGLLDVNLGNNGGASVGNGSLLELEPSTETEELIEIDLGGLF